MKISIKHQGILRQKYGHWAIVTGATSGIGLELAIQLAQAGLNLVIVARGEARLSIVADQLKQYPVKVKTVAADLSTSEGVTSVIGATEGLPVGLLVNNAGFGTSGLFVNSDIGQEMNMLRLNCETVLLLTHHFANQFKEQKRGGIIFLSSLVAFQGVPYAAHYAATKAYVQTFAEALAIELKQYHVDVLSVAPGPVKSGFGERADMSMGGAMSPEKIGVPILRALGKQSHVVPGLLSKVLTYALATAPRFLKVRIMQQVMGGFTAHQRT